MELYCKPPPWVASLRRKVFSKIVFDADDKQFSEFFHLEGKGNFKCVSLAKQGIMTDSDVSRKYGVRKGHCPKMFLMVKVLSS